VKITEQTWLLERAHPQHLAGYAFARGKRRLSRRRAYLLAVAAVRCQWPHDAGRPELGAVERYAEGQCEEAEFAGWRDRVYAHQAEWGTINHGLQLLFNLHSGYGLQILASQVFPWRTADDDWCDLIREIAGNPFRPWKAIPEAMGGGLVQPDGATVVPSAAARAVAAGIAADQGFDRLPVLADALEDSGVTDAELLAHCRRLGGHLRGCWAVDVVLGRT
jgi:hypothetical protein